VLTRRGLAAGLAAVICYISAVLLHWVEPAVLATGLVVVLVIGAAWVARRPRLRITRTIEPRRVTRGEVALGLLSVNNRGYLAVSSSVASEPCGDRVVTIALPRLARGRTSQVTYVLPTDRRAVLDVGPLFVNLSSTRSDPYRPAALAVWKVPRPTGCRSGAPRFMPSGSMCRATTSATSTGGRQPKSGR
jgi:hypothetical protein